ncbi:hypothetical protein [Fibrobacter sp.]
MNIKTSDTHRQSKAEYLIKKYQSDPKGHREALTLLVDLYQREIKDWSGFFYRRNYAFRPENSLKDYEGVATTAVLKAARKYDCENEADFKTFLRYYVAGECLELVRDTGNTLRMPRTKKKMVQHDESTCEKCGNEEEERKERKAISFDDVPFEDMLEYDRECKRCRQHKLEVQRKMGCLQEMLEDLCKNSKSVVLKKHAKRVRAFKEHVFAGGNKSSFSRVLGTKHRGTLNTALEAICNYFKKNRT